MRAKIKHLLLLIIITAIIIGAFLIASQTNKSAALSYQSSVGVQFTFNTTLNLSLSSADLIIPALAPGSSSDSNEITINVGTNAAYGYTLLATAGTSATNTNLTHTTNNNYIFTSLLTTDNLASLTTDNTWGYAFATYDSATAAWNNYSSYSGLPLDNNDQGETAKQLISTNNQSSGEAVKFKIAARAATTQASGEYANIINFYAVVNPEPEP